MISGIALTIALFGALATIKYAMTCAGFHVLIGQPQVMIPKYRSTYARYGASIAISVVVTIGGAFIAGMYA